MNHFIQHLLDTARKYNVNPYIFVTIYIGAIPFFTVSVGWLVRNLRKKRSITLPILCAGLAFTSAYIYLIIVGKNVPFWVYMVIGLLIVFGIYSTFRKVRKELSDKEVS